MLCINEMDLKAPSFSTKPYQAFFDAEKMSVQSLVSRKKKSFIGLPAPLGYVPGLGRGLTISIFLTFVQEKNFYLTFC